MEEGAADSETVNAVFRAVHSIKGGAGAFKLDRLVRFAHVFETTLDKIRSEQLAPAPAVMKHHVARGRRARRSRQGRARRRRDRRRSAHRRADRRTEAPQRRRDAGAGRRRRASEAERSTSSRCARLRSRVTPAIAARRQRAIVIGFKPKPELYARATRPRGCCANWRAWATLAVACDARRRAAARRARSRRRLSRLARRADARPRTRRRSASVFEFVDGDCELDDRRARGGDRAADATGASRPGAACADPTSPTPSRRGRAGRATAAPARPRVSRSDRRRGVDRTSRATRESRRRQADAAAQRARSASISTASTG